MKQQEFIRNCRTDECAELLKQIDIKQEQIKFEEIILAVMVKYNVARRTALEYLKAGKYKNDHS